MNIKQLMKQAQQMQEQMQQQDVADTRVSRAPRAAAWSRRPCSGTKELLAIAIDKEAVDPDDVEMLQDLIVAAVNEAARKVDEELQSARRQMRRIKIPGYVARPVRLVPRD